MRRLISLLTLLAALIPAAAAHAATPGSAACVTERPVALTFTRAAGRTVGTLRWKAGRRAPAHSRYRVWRNGKVVGQTSRHWMRVNVSLAHRYTLRVRLVTPAGQVLACPKPVLRVSTAYRLPSVPLFPSVSGGGSGQTVRISWQRSAPGDGGLAGYRVLRDGAVYAQTRSTSTTVRVSSNRSYTFAVMSVDRHGRHSAPSRSVRLETGHSAPAAPTALQGASAGPTRATLTWQPSAGTIAGYRILRNGTPLGQYHSTSVTLANLTPSTTYQYAVVAVDSLGYVSAASAPVSIRTDAPGAPTAPGSLLGAPLNSTTIQLSWQPSVAAQGRITGYRILRDGTSVGQFSGTSAVISNLFSSTTYTFTVIAEDSLGNLSNADSTVTVRTADPTPTSGHTYAFLLADTGQSFTDFQNHYAEIGTVSPTYYDCNQTTTLSGANVPLITQWAQARQVRVLPRFNCQNTSVLDQMLHSSTIEQQWTSYIVGQVTSNGYDGATVDFEAGPAADRALYTAFITNLAAQLHAAGKLLDLAVSAKTSDVQNSSRSTFFDYDSLSAQVDEMFVMAWGIHWATSAPGAQDDMTWVQGVVNYISTLPRANKYILGMQLYAMDWANGGGSANPASTYEYANVQALAAQVGATPTLNPTSDALTFSYTDANGVHHDVWFTNSQTEGDRITLAHNSGLGGIGVWRLGEEDQNLWNNPLLNGTW